jgi:Caspase domain
MAQARLFEKSLRWLLPGTLVFSVTGCVLAQLPAQISPKVSQQVSPKVLKNPSTESVSGSQGFMVFGGGGAPSYNEIAIEKNIFYFQRTLKVLGQSPESTSIWFANGGDGRKTVRYVEGDRERFKAPTVDPMEGPATLANLNLALGAAAESPTPLFFYFTGHGFHNLKNENDNAMVMWDEDLMTVQNFTRQLDRMPPKKPFVTVMVQCYSGSFANLIYQGGKAKNGVAKHDRCGFFATVKSLPSVGCTPEVDEADYQDYSSSFFAGLSGVSRTGKKVASADYDGDGRVAFREAHAFAKIDEQASDLPISTVEAWLQEGLTSRDRTTILMMPIGEILKSGRPEQVKVVTVLAKSLGYDLGQSDRANRRDRKPKGDELKQTYRERLSMELLNIQAEFRVRRSAKSKELEILERLLECEGRSI